MSKKRTVLPSDEMKCSFIFFYFYLSLKAMMSKPGGDANQTHVYVPENALDALLDELQTFAKPSDCNEVNHCDTRLDGPLNDLDNKIIFNLI